MEMAEVAMIPPPLTVLPPSAASEFNFDSNCSSPYITAPSSPQRFGNFFFSAPTSPTRVSAVAVATATAAASLYGVDISLISADSISPRNVLMSPRRKRDENFDPFAAAIEETRKNSNQDREPNPENKLGRGRERSSARIKGTRSLSPMRVSDALLFDPEENSSDQFSGKIVSDPNSTSNNSRSAYSSILSAISFANRKWKLKDLLLFRSASEGRASSVSESFRKYAVLSKKPATAPAPATAPEDVRNSSFRSTDSVGSVSSRRRGPAVSAHELHYTGLMEKGVY
ncbi:hypothetical protein G4B88_011428 [Cannabis sativa]|uniref:Uncharacterized protein n=1 Tax=Cannabis sativa TaxID=3483 RepID=A0A7J6GHR6_CANSA|nr:hypothetical protein G4B88_011428 [Cannabis sativa]